MTTNIFRSDPGTINHVAESRYQHGCLAASGNRQGIRSSMPDIKWLTPDLNDFNGFGLARVYPVDDEYFYMHTGRTAPAGPTAACLLCRQWIREDILRRSLGMRWLTCLCRRTDATHGLTMYDLGGHAVASRTGRGTHFDISDMAPGIYIIRTNGSLTSVKIIVTR